MDPTADQIEAMFRAMYDLDMNKLAQRNLELKRELLRAEAQLAQFKTDLTQYEED